MKKDDAISVLEFVVSEHFCPIEIFWDNVGKDGDAVKKKATELYEYCWDNYLGYQEFKKLANEQIVCEYI